MKKIVFLFFMICALTNVDAQIGGITPSNCNEVVTQLKGHIVASHTLEMTWLYDTSCSVPPCGPPGDVQYRIEVESGYNDGFGNIIWSGTVVSYTMNELNTEPNPEFSAYVGQRTEFARFRVKIVNATDCNPWSYWQVCTA